MSGQGYVKKDLAGMSVFIRVWIEEDIIGTYICHNRNIESDEKFLIFLQGYVPGRDALLLLVGNEDGTFSTSRFVVGGVKLYWNL